AGREWVSLHTPGHTDDHLCLYDPVEGVVLSGDHVLPTITPHISGLVAGADPLTAFFGSLDKVSALDGVTLALPAHGHPSAAPAAPLTSGLVAGAGPPTAFFGPLDKVSGLDGVTLALPAHGPPFADLAGRAKAIRQHHEERLELLRDAAAELGSATVEDLSKRL